MNQKFTIQQHMCIIFDIPFLQIHFAFSAYFGDRRVVGGEQPPHQKHTESLVTSIASLLNVNPTKRDAKLQTLASLILRYPVGHCGLPLTSTLYSESSIKVYLDLEES